MEATRLIAVRHGETAWNTEARIQGHLDIGLNEKGRWQALQLRRALAEEEFCAVYASDLARARDTAAAIAGPRAMPVQADTGLRERSFGRFEGRRFAEIEAESPELALRWRRRDPAFAPEGGESLVVFRQRVMACAARIAARHPGQQVLLVAHGGVMDLLYRAATGQELAAPRTWQLGNAAINRLLWSPQGFALVGWGDDAHLAGATLDEPGA